MLRAFLVVVSLFAVSFGDICQSGKPVDDATFSALFSSLQGASFDSDRLTILEAFVNTTSLGLNSSQVVLVLSTLGFSNTKVTALSTLNSHILALSCLDVVSVLKTLAFANDQLSVLPELANLIYIPDLQTNNATIVSLFGFSADQDKARQIINNATGVSCTFGPLAKPRVVFVIDVSGSMSTTFQFNGVSYSRLSFVQNELYDVIGTQLRPPLNFFNIEIFSSSYSFWAPGLQIASPVNQKSAMNYARGLVANGSTQTGLALTGAWADPLVQAIYLLSDGNPDDPQGSFAAVQKLYASRPIPVYTTALAADAAGKKFMQLVANYTAGVYREINGN